MVGYNVNEIIKYRRVCAWCKRVLVDGDPGAPTTHTICEDCDRKEQEKADEEDKCKSEQL